MTIETIIPISKTFRGHQLPPEPHHSEAYGLWEGRSYPPERVLEHIQRIQDPGYKALASFLYLTGCRVSEVIPYVGHQEWPDKQGILKSQIVLDPAHPNKVKVYGIRNLKRRLTRMRKEAWMDAEGKVHTRYVPREDKNARVPKTDLYREVGFSVGKREQPFWELFWSYAQHLLPEQQLFPFPYFAVYRRLAQRTLIDKDGNYRTKPGGRINPHALRHQRFTHLVNIYRLHPQQLRRKAGWASSMTADKYVDTSSEDMIEQEERIQQQQP
jgi:integrase